MIESGQGKKWSVGLFEIAARNEQERRNPKWAAPVGLGEQQALMFSETND